MRIANITVRESDDIFPRQFTLCMEILSDKISTEEDLVTAVRKACTDFVASDFGKRIYEANCHCFNWADMEMEVPESFCLKHGFRLLPTPKTEMNVTVNWDEHLVNDDELETENK